MVDGAAIVLPKAACKAAEARSHQFVAIHSTPRPHEIANSPQQFV
jgi:hypothetical protein